MGDELSRRQFLTLLGIGATSLAATPWLWGSDTPAVAGLIARPYLQPGPHAGHGLDSKTLLWLTDGAGGDFTVEYGWEGSAVQTATVQPYKMSFALPTPEQLNHKPPVEADHDHEHDPDHEAAHSPSGFREQRYVKYSAALNDLPRDANAWYRVRSTTHLVAEENFRTRATAENAVRFVAIGDMANGKEGQNAIAYQTSLLKPDFVLALGDIVYPNGRVSQYVDHFWRTYLNVDRPSATRGAPLMATIPFYGVVGNHDADASLGVFPDSLGIYYFFQAPTNGPGIGRWTTPMTRGKAETAAFRAAAGTSYPSLSAYSFDEGPAHIIVLDSNSYAKTDSPELLQWIERDLTGSNARWKFVCMHTPMFHSSPAHYTEQKMRRLSPLLERCGVDVVFSGHVHNYQRSRPMRFNPAPAKPADKLVNGEYAIDTHFDGVNNTRASGIIHIVSGGGGGTLYQDPLEKLQTLMPDKFGANWAPFTAKHVVDRHSLVTCDLTPGQLIIRAVDQDGKEVDRAVVTKA